MKINKKIIITAIGIILIGAGVAYALNSNPETPSPTTNQSTDNQAQTTEQQNEEANQKKDEVVNSQENQQPKPTPTPVTTKKPITPVITNAGQYGSRVEVRAFMPSIYESGGTCTATFTQGTKKFSRQTEGIKDATTTRCDVFLVPLSDFSSGDWKVIVTYNSSIYSGSSSATSFKVAK